MCQSCYQTRCGICPKKIQVTESHGFRKTEWDSTDITVRLCGKGPSIGPSTYVSRNGAGSRQSKRLRQVQQHGEKRKIPIKKSTTVVEIKTEVNILPGFEFTAHTSFISCKNYLTFISSASGSSIETSNYWTTRRLLSPCRSWLTTYSICERNRKMIQTERPRRRPERVALMDLAAHC